MADLAPCLRAQGWLGFPAEECERALDAQDGRVEDAMMWLVAQADRL